MGVEILWFMPITPISNKDRKGTLRKLLCCAKIISAVNPEFGSLQDY